MFRVEPTAVALLAGRCSINAHSSSTIAMAARAAEHTTQQQLQTYLYIPAVQAIRNGEDRRL